MYYITNQTQQIIAADQQLLKLLHVENVNELYKEIVLENIKVSTSENEVTFVTPLTEFTSRMQKHSLSSMLGEMFLVELLNDTNSEVIQNEIVENSELSTPTLSLDDDILDLDLLAQDEEPSINNASEEISLSLDDDFLLDTDNIVLAEPTPAIEINNEDEDELYNLLLPEDGNETINNISAITSEEVVEETTPILIDSVTISQKIGISTDDYQTFLDEYVETTLSLEDDFQNTDEDKFTSAISSTLHLANVLHLPMVTNIVNELKDAPTDKKEEVTKSLYNTIARLTTKNVSSDNQLMEESVKPSTMAIEDDVLSLDIELEPTPSIPEVEPEVEAVQGFGTISLDDVEPIHFDFQTEAAANDLSLPVELIEEFVHDFIEQAHVETKNMLEAYKQGDLDTIQKIGHLLKGTSSNLRITPLADTLYEIQFCEDPTKFEALIKNYWAHFISFETQINLTSN